MRDIIVVGAPVGGAAALITLAGSLPGDLPASIFVVLHTTVETPILLADVLNAPGRMRVTDAVDGETIEPSRIYVACDGKHLVLEDARIRLAMDSEENGRRPSIDVLFQSAATSHRERVVGVLLLHAEEDGVRGLYAIRQNGGRTVTHRNEQMADKPRHSETGEELAHDHLPLGEIAPRVIAYVQGANGNGSTVPAGDLR